MQQLGQDCAIYCNNLDLFAREFSGSRFAKTMQLDLYAFDNWPQFMRLRKVGLTSCIIRRSLLILSV